MEQQEAKLDGPRQYLHGRVNQNTAVVLTQLSESDYLRENGISNDPEEPTEGDDIFSPSSSFTRKKQFKKRITMEIKNSFKFGRAEERRLNFK